MGTIRYSVVFSFLLIGCEPEQYERPTWEHVTTEEVRMDINQLSGEFTESTPAAILENVLEETGIIYLAEIVGPIIGSKDLSKSAYDDEAEVTPRTMEWEDEEYGMREGALEGQAAAWIRFSCPGQVIENPILDFSQGFIQLDGDGLSYDSGSSNVENNTNLLLRFETCIAGPMKIVGSIPTFISSLSGEVAMRTNLRIERDERTFELKIPILFDEGGVTFAVDLDESRFALTLPSTDLFADPLDFRIRALNGTYDCSYRYGTSDVVCSDTEDSSLTYRSPVPDMF